MKGRQEQHRYLVEGDKLSREWLHQGKNICHVLATSSWLREQEALLQQHPETLIHEVTPDELARVSTQKTPHDALLVVALPDFQYALPQHEWCIALDRLQDPGNLGSILRIADWFGIGHVVCSPGCANFFNPKVIAAGMGAHLRVALHETSLEAFLAQCQMPVFAAALQGTPISQFPKQKAATLLIGNESTGIYPALLQRATHKVHIPGGGGAESLNAAVSAGILVAALFGGIR
ncbi:MAG: RNA methyltransferase [Bacteroidetes bacterium]|nr:RNA methyltransferase [Bacteroidota bacterium]MBS1629245.1 RNA methyltransferase [Bacteroidota bacterium]